MPSRDPALAEKVLQDAFAKISRRFTLWFPGWSLLITCTHRTPAEQLLEFKAGRSRIDGYVKLGAHNYRPSRAIDVMIVTPGGKLIDGEVSRGVVDRSLARAIYGIVGMWVQAEGLRWGGDWDGDKLHVEPDPDESLNDPYHWEITNFRTWRPE